MADYDDNIDNYDAGLNLLVIVLPASAIIIILLFTIPTFLMIAWAVYHYRRHVCDSLLKYIRRQLKKELAKEEFNERMYNDLQDMLQQVLNIKNKISGFEGKRRDRVSLSNAMTQTDRENEPNSMEMMQLEEGDSSIERQAAGAEGGGTGAEGGGTGAEGGVIEEDLNATGSIVADGPTAREDGEIKSPATEGITSLLFLEHINTNINVLHLLDCMHGCIIHLFSSMQGKSKL